MKPSLSKFKSVFSLDSSSLAIFRIALAATILFDLASRIPEFNVFYTAYGILPRTLFLSMHAANPCSISLYFANDTPLFVLLLLILNALIAALLLIGWRTRLMTILSWFFLISLHNRNPLILNSGDYILRYILFWSMFLPLGAEYSWDSQYSKRSTENSFQINKMVFIVQIFSVFWFDAYLKLHSAIWMNGTAMFCAFSAKQNASCLASWILTFPGILRFLTYTVFVWEIVGPLCLLLPFGKRFKMAIIIGFWVQAAIFAIFLDIGLFPFVSSLVMLPFIPSPKHNFHPNTPTKQTVVKGLSHWISAITSNIKYFFKWLPQPRAMNRLFPPNSRLISFFAVFLMIYSTVWNVGAVNSNLSLAPAVKRLGFFLAFEERLQMFIPERTYTGWCVFRGEQRDGREVDVVRGDHLDYGYPKNFGTFDRSALWKRCFLRLWDRDYYEYYQYITWYYCQHWNRRNVGFDQVKRIDVFAITEKFYPVKDVPQRHLVYSHICIK